MLVLVLAVGLEKKKKLNIDSPAYIILCPRLLLMTERRTLRRAEILLTR